MTTTTTMTTNEAKPFLAAASKQEIAAALKAAGQPGYRADQVYDWIVKKWIVDPALMTNLSASAKEALSAAFLCPSVAIEAEYPADDGSAKYLLRLHDGEAVECARIPAEDGRMTFCLSSQVGCPVSCVFCSSGESGLTRNLAAGEIIEQYFLLCRKLGQAPDNVVMMGIGEPLLNFDNLVAALNVITNPDGVALAQRRVTISTSGWTPGIKALTALRKQWNLALSLHAPDDKTRAMLIPTKFRRDIREILAACQEHREATGRLLTIEYVLLAGINDSPEMGRKFARLAADAGAKVNLIPYNKARGAFERPSREAVKRFENALKTLHVPVTVRVEKGASATAACGQLRANSKKSAAGKAVTLFAAVLTLLAATSCFSSEPKELSAHQRELMAQIYSPEEDLAPLYEALSCTDPNFIDPETGRTPLMTAVALSDAPRVSALLASGADPDAKDTNGIRAIHYAAGEPDPAILRTLIVGGADVNAKGRTGKTPVMEAARLGMIQNVKILADAGADLDARDDLDRNVVMFGAMAKQSSLDIVKCLLENGAPDFTFTSKGDTPLFLAIDHGNSDTALYLLRRIEEFAGNQGIHAGPVDIEYTVFNRYNEATAIGLAAMRHAIYANDMKVVQALVERKLPLNSSVNRVYRVMKRTNIEGFHELLARNGVIEDGKKPLFWAAETDNVPIMKYLVEHGADPHEIDHAGNRPIAYARRREAVDYLQTAMKQ
ncbi:MAG: 23S rRNA (adenine(2503)-C(2))-methyltransferase RlmN [Lentisphaeria bacterium]|nr:23S rRNA (adenine(2503)-C(2))-methyltransferase RlmN [Lentisphaeria bacterium]